MHSSSPTLQIGKELLNHPHRHQNFTANPPFTFKMAVLEENEEIEETAPVGIIANGSWTQGKTEINSTPVIAERESRWQMPDVGKANCAAFRKFDIDEFDIPTGDDSAAMAGVWFNPLILTSFKSLSC
jgi:hypothetical protein